MQRKILNVYLYRDADNLFKLRMVTFYHLANEEERDALEDEDQFPPLVDNIISTLFHLVEADDWDEESMQVYRCCEHQTDIVNYLGSDYAVIDISFVLPCDNLKTLLRIISLLDGSIHAFVYEFPDVEVYYYQRQRITNPVALIHQSLLLTNYVAPEKNYLGMQPNGC